MGGVESLHEYFDLNFAAFLVKRKKKDYILFDLLHDT